MRKILTTAAIGLGLATATLAMPSAAVARNNSAVITFSFGNVAYGYRDGYWDHHHHWHRWQHRQDVNNYRNSDQNHYSDWAHTRDRRNQGWHG